MDGPIPVYPYFGYHLMDNDGIGIRKDGIESEGKKSKAVTTIFFIHKD